MIKNLECSVNDQELYVEAYIPDTDDENYPTVIISHGLSLDHTFMKEYAQKLLKHNIASILFDFRGGGYDSKSDGKISDMSILTEIDDMNAVIDLALSCDFVDKDQIYLAGHSQGGLVSTLVAPKRVDQIQNLFLFAPAFVITDDVNNIDDMREDSIMTLMPEYLGDTYINGAKTINLYDDVVSYPKRVYIFHGRKDKRVPVNYSIEANQVYDNSELIIYEDQQHRFDDSTKDLVVDKIADVITSNM